MFFIPELTTYTEHEHSPILTAVSTSLALNNPDQIVDPVFGLLGNAAAAGVVPIGGDVDGVKHQ